MRQTDLGKIDAIEQIALIWDHFVIPLMRVNLLYHIDIRGIYTNLAGAGWSDYFGRGIKSTPFEAGRLEEGVLPVLSQYASQSFSTRNFPSRPLRHGARGTKFFSKLRIQAPPLSRTTKIKPMRIRMSGI